MRRITAMALLLLVAAAATVAYQGAARGTVVHEDGSPAVKVEVQFRRGEDTLYTAWTDENGEFYLSNPGNGTYAAWVNGRECCAVNIDNDGLHPSTLIIP